MPRAGHHPGPTAGYSVPSTHVTLLSWGQPGLLTTTPVERRLRCRSSGSHPVRAGPGNVQRPAGRRGACEAMAHPRPMIPPPEVVAGSQEEGLRSGVVAALLDSRPLALPNSTGSGSAGSDRFRRGGGVRCSVPPSGSLPFRTSLALPTSAIVPPCSALMLHYRVAGGRRGINGVRNHVASTIRVVRWVQWSSRTDKGQLTDSCRRDRLPST
jgi:hypothetical protein